MTTEPQTVTDIERGIRLAIWNAGMRGGMGQDLTQAFIRRAMEDPTMVSALAALAAAPVAPRVEGAMALAIADAQEVARLAEREACALVADEHGGGVAYAIGLAIRERAVSSDAPDNEREYICSCGFRRGGNPNADAGF